MAYMAWDSPEIIGYSKDKEETAYQFRYIIGSMLLTIMLAFIGKNAADILADKQLMGNAKLQFRGILSQRDCIALAAGYPSGKIDADAAEKICEKVEYGETTAEDFPLTIASPQ